MILVADSGSTKTDWRLIDGSKNNQVSFNTLGFNPYFINEEGIIKALSSSTLSAYKKNISAIYFYGAGCSSEAKSNIVKTALQTFFNATPTVFVAHDLLAAARAVSNKNASLVAILGTGANTCFYDGTDIVENIPALGYLLGDEGSGAHLGLNFIKKYLHHAFSADINAAFQKKYPTYTLNTILDAVYKQSLPNRFLAQFSHFILSHKENNAIQELILSCFTAFFEQYIIRYPNYQNYSLNLVGSVAYHYQDFIKQVAANYGVIIEKIVKQPIDGLVDYHLEK